MTPPSALLERFRASGRLGELFPEEIEILGTDAVATMSADAQLAFLKTNRRVAARILPILGGIRLVVLSGAGVACAWFGLHGLSQGSMGWIRIALAIFGFLMIASAISLAWALVQRIRRYRVPLEMPQASGEGARP